MSKIYYYSRINCKKHEEYFGKNAHVGPAYKKISGIISALKLHGCVCEVVTTPVIKKCFSLNRILFSKVIENNIFYNISPSVGIPVFDRFLAVICFFLHSIFIVKRKDSVILYNFFPEYFLAAIFLRIFKSAAILDIEDAPRDDERGVRGFVNRVSYKWLKKVCRRRCLTVSGRVGKDLDLYNPGVVYGVFPDSIENARSRPFGFDGINVIYGGSIQKDTGVFEFIGLIKALIDKSELIGLRINFFVTGFGDLSDILAIKDTVNESKKISLSVFGGVSLNEYESLLKEMDVGLCLKRSNSEMGQTTFPSKVVEICSAGLLLVSTPVSDVPYIFDKNSAVITDGDVVNSLCGSFIDMSLRPNFYSNVASVGNSLAARLFGAEAVSGIIMGVLDSPE